MVSWTYGVTTVPNRQDLLERTLASLAKGGFDDPILFVDGTHPQVPSLGTCLVKDLIKVYRERNLGPFSNFVLGLWELYLRNPTSNRYAMFQDDMVCYVNLRSYLDSCKMPDNSYWNLYTWPVNVKENIKGWSLSDQCGRGAVALVFSNEGLRHLLMQKFLVNHKQDSHRMYKHIDRAVAISYRDSGWHEYIHVPSLVQHIGTYSSCKNSTHPISPVFEGETYDATLLIK
jgi:hypothetical protein